MNTPAKRPGRTWLKRIAIALGVLVVVGVAVDRGGIPFIGPRSSGLDEAGVRWYRSYNGSNWLDESYYFKFRASPRDFAEVQRILRFRLQPDREVSKGFL